MPKSRTGWGLLIGTALLAVLVVIGIVPRVRQNAELVAASTSPDAGLVQVSVTAPKRADGPIHLVLPSNIQAIEEAAIYARTSGYVRERYVDIGDRVAAGKALAQIDTPELDQELSQARAALAQTRSGLAQARASFTQAQANLNQARAGLEQSKANESFAGVTADRFGKLERDELIAHQDADEKRTAHVAARATTAVSQANVEAMQANLDALEASVDAARASVVASEANVQRLMALQSFQRVEAPFAGIITVRGIDRGARRRGRAASRRRAPRRHRALPGRAARPRPRTIGRDRGGPQRQRAPRREPAGRLEGRHARRGRGDQAQLVVEVLWATEYSSGRESASVSTTDSRASSGGAPAPRRPAARTAPRTMFEKIWARHVVAEGPGGHVLLYIDRHLLHEGTT